MLKIQPLPATSQQAFDDQLDEEAFVLYSGISTQQAQAICDDSNGEIEFHSEFWGPFQDYIAAMCKGICNQPTKNLMSKAEAKAVIESG